MQIPIQALMQMGGENPLLADAGLAPAQTSHEGGLFAQLLRTLQQNPLESGAAASGVTAEQAIAAVVPAERAVNEGTLSALAELVPAVAADGDAGSVAPGAEVASAGGDPAGDSVADVAEVVEPGAGFSTASAAMAEVAAVPEAGNPVLQLSNTSVEHVQENDVQAEAVLPTKTQPGSKTGAKGVANAGQATASPEAAEANAPVATSSRSATAPGEPAAATVTAADSTRSGVKANAEAPGPIVAAPVEAPQETAVLRAPVAPEQAQALHDGVEAARTEPRQPSASEASPVRGSPGVEGQTTDVAAKPSGNAKPEAGVDPEATRRHGSAPALEAAKPATTGQVRMSQRMARGPASPHAGESAGAGSEVPREVPEAPQALADEQARARVRVAHPGDAQAAPDTQRDAVAAPVLQAEAAGGKLRQRATAEGGKPAAPIPADDDGVASEPAAPLLGRRASVPKSWLAPERPLAQANAEASADGAMAGPEREAAAGLKAKAPEPLAAKAAVADPVHDAGAQQTRVEPGQGPAVGVEQAAAKPMPSGTVKAGEAPPTQPAPAEPVTLDAMRDPVVRQVRYLVSRGEQTLQVRLKPASLGELRIEVASGGESVSVRLVSANPVVREALEGQAGGLRQALSAEGIDVTDVLVSADASYEQASQGQAGRGAMQPQHSGRPAQSFSQAYNGSQPKDSPMRQSRRHHDGGLNLYA